MVDRQLSIDIMKVIDETRERWGHDPARTDLLKQLRQGFFADVDLGGRRWSIGGHVCRMAADLGFVVYHDARNPRTVRIGFAEDHDLETLDLTPYCSHLLSKE